MNEAKRRLPDRWIDIGQPDGPKMDGPTDGQINGPKKRMDKITAK